MTYNEHLAERVRDALPDLGVVREQQMFGSLVFMVAGHMCCGVLGDDLMLRLGRQEAEAACVQPSVREFDFTGRPMRSIVLVEQAGLDEAALRGWVDRAVSYVETLPRR